MIEEPVLSEFRRICQQFFPRWQAGATWTVHSGYRSDETSESGFCDPATRRLYVAPYRRISDLRLILVHECCHAVAGLGHEKRWRARMLKAASTAVRIGEAELGELLREEVRAYEAVPKTTAAYVY